MKSDPIQYDDLQAGKEVFRERRLRRKDKSIIIVEVSAKMLDDGRIQVFVRDITGRKQAEADLLKNETRLLEAQRVASIGSFEVDIYKDKLWWSEELYNLFGQDPAHFIPTKDGFTQLVHPDDRDEYIAALMHSIESGERLKREFRAKNADAKWRHFETTANVTFDDKGKALGLRGTVQDITERKQVEEALQQSEHRYRSLFDDSPISIWEEDFSEVKKYLDSLDGLPKNHVDSYLAKHPEIVRACASRVKILDVNQASLRLHNAADKTELLAGLETTFTDASYETFRKELVAIVNGEKDISFEAKIKTLDGYERAISLRWSVAPGFDHSLARVLVTIEDITERKELEQEKVNLEKQLRHSQKLETIGTLAGGIAHDFNNILTPIMGYADMALADLPLTGPLRDDLGSILDGAHRAKNLVDQSYCSAGKLKKSANRSGYI